MGEINDLVKKVQVLTIKRNSDRHDYVSEILKSVNFEFYFGLDLTEIYPGIQTINEIPDNYFFEYNIDKKHVIPYTKGQLGAYTAIRNMIFDLADENSGATLIFEDDLLPLKNNWISIFNKSLNELPNDWDILLLGYLYDGKIYQLNYRRAYRFVSRFINYFKKMFGFKYIQVLPVKYSKHLDSAGVCTGGHAYCLSKNGAIKLKHYLSPMRESGDELIVKLITENKINAYSVYPCLFLQNSSFASKTRMKTV